MPASEAAVERLARSRAAGRRRCAKPAPIALRVLPRPLKQLDQGTGNSPVSEADIAVNDLLHERAGRARRSAGCRRKARTIRRGLQRAASGWSIRSTARAPIIAGRADWSIVGGAGRRRPAGAWPRCSRRSTDEMFVADGGRRRDAQRRADPASAPAAALDGARVAGPKRMLDRLAGVGPGIVADAARAFAGAAAGARRARPSSMRRSPAATATTGTLRLPIFWCTKPAAC